ncbi:GTPase Era [Candidatus Roizmanbacteria bacterium RIFCSPLOWO2_01_FULL_45_11]|uniref:GTPase Era n=1 Tax=Candidatus Roizmanbacteria bacterium RIFCSPLOWO2_01_FULL_45_11 TaxID=1802070 RepID=A0A1F7JJ73_9BACT|nr:MAG: GTPase Era [Candidatus Roizmanbacteria bacterium RIFCSPLOWO2_01_FULL_45_11]
MKAGIVALIGRPNAGKSTLLNTLLQQKVTITSPKPNTTRFPIEAVYEDTQGQIIFIDTPGLTNDVLSEKPHVVAYLIDHTRRRGSEENQTLGIVRKFGDIPKVLALNKIDVEKPSFRSQYKFLEEEFDDHLEVSGLTGKHLKSFIDVLFKHLPEGEKLVDTDQMITPLLNMDSKTFIAELVREKVFLSTGQEVPYRVGVKTLEVTERNNGSMYIRAVITTDNDRHKQMIIGSGAKKIKQIGSMARKELELATGKKIYLELTVQSSED